MAPESRPPNASEREDKQQLVNNLATGLLAGGEKEMAKQVNNELDPQMAVDILNNDDKKLGVQDSEQQARDNNTIRQTGIMNLPREIMDKVFGNLSQEDHKSLRVVCGKFEQILNPLVFRRAHISKARIDLLAFWNVSFTPKLAVHIKELVWYELAEDESVFLETANDAMPAYRGNRGRQLVDAVQHDNNHTLPDLSNLASTLFWLPATPKQDDPNRDAIESQRSMILGRWFPLLYQALESLPKLDTFTSRPMPAYHVLSSPDCDYKFVAYLFQVDIRSDIQDYQRNDGLFTVLLPAMTRLRQTIKHLHWADEAYGNSSSIKRIRHRHGLSFKYLKSIDLCLSLPTDTRIRRPWARGFERTCWSMLGACLDRVRGLEEISLCFEKANPQVGIHALMDALDECLFSEDIQLVDLTSLNLRDGPSRRVRLLDHLLSRFLIRYGPTLRHLSFRRWSVSQNLLHRLSASEKMNLEGFKIDNNDFESGASIPESNLLAFLNNRAPRWPLPLGQISCKSTIGSADEEFMDIPGVRDWANPKFANIPEGMDFCAAVLEGTTPSNDEDEDDEDEDFEPSDSSDDSDSDFDSDFDSEFDFDPAEVDPSGNFDPDSDSGDGYEVSEGAGSD